MLLKRNRAYYRQQRRRAIRKKVYIYKEIWGNEQMSFAPGYYAKNKVHCSCKMCKYEKHNDLPKAKVAAILKQMLHDIDYEWDAI